MGIDVCAIYKHNLNTDNIETLASQIATIYKAKVEYEVYNEEFETLKMGIVGQGRPFRLTNQIYEDDPMYQYSFDLTNLAPTRPNEFESHGLFIYKHIIETGLSGGRWWSFTDLVFDRKESYYLNHFRKSLSEESKIFNAQSAIYYPEYGYGNVGFLQEDMIEMTWENLFTKIKQKFGERLIDVSEMIRDEITKCPFNSIEVMIDDFSCFGKSILDK